MAQVLKEEIKNRIIESGINCFMANGFQKTTMKEISEDSGISVGNLYRYFPNKRSLYDEIIKPFYLGIELMTKEVHATIEQEEKPDIDFLTSRAYKRLFELFQNQRRIAGIVIRDPGSLEFHETMSTFINMLSASLKVSFEMYTQKQMHDEIFYRAFANSIVYGFISIVASVPEAKLNESLENFIKFSFGMIKERYMSLFDK
ncbi:TetR/AcrR family transcriptional regulator [Fusibacter ferrireducens]|uniref:TetR/AcrR family transcriptional regulator n=1 Tax=Fusibacter ferrireducens TaxID=2785058 RepID=A0ABR9ZN80_9FIRM|nr:TetR/AcrR family transcriptional regulator [Fusibacter ferrireducens]MBF4691578.1 TetR/AcrR family transcriptional regulator [Fusibacter ferrireducens]